MCVGFFSVSFSVRFLSQKQPNELPHWECDNNIQCVLCILIFVAVFFVSVDVQYSVDVWFLECCSVSKLYFR